MSKVQFNYRKDNDGQNPIHSIANEVYSSDSKEVSNWITLDMNKRDFPKVTSTSLSLISVLSADRTANI